MDNIEPLYHIQPDSYNKAFILGGIVSGVSTALVMEYRFRDPFNMYKDEKDHKTRLTNILMIIVVAFIFSYISSWVVRLLFGYGVSDIVK